MTADDSTSKSKTKYRIETRNDDNDDSNNISPVTQIVFSMLLPALNIISN
jgi:hypothetical protein